jgi:hypothetical protein
MAGATIRPARLAAITSFRRRLSDRCRAWPPGAGGGPGRGGIAHRSTPRPGSGPAGTAAAARTARAARRSAGHGRQQREGDQQHNQHQATGAAQQRDQHGDLLTQPTKSSQIQVRTQARGLTGPAGRRPPSRTRPQTAHQPSSGERTGLLVQPWRAYACRACSTVVALGLLHLQARQRTVTSSRSSTSTNGHAIACTSPGSVGCQATARRASGRTAERVGTRFA